MPALDVAENRSPRSSLWTDRKFRAVVTQIVVIAGLFAFFAYIISNAVANLDALGKSFGFDFLWTPASYDIDQTLIEYNSRDTHFRAGLVGILNTLLVAGCGIVLATIIGFILGVLRLSHNWVVNRLAYCYVEFVRNVPLLVHILLLHGLIVNTLPVPKNALQLGDGWFLTNRGFYVPKPEFEPAFWAVVVALAIGVAIAIGYRRYARRLQDETGEISPVGLVSLGAIVGLPIIAYLVAGMPLHWSLPVHRGFNFQGGLVLRPEFTALWLALSLYTASYIGEIVRAGIESVSHGQTEAAHALGLRRGRTLRLVVIPQALRVIVPPLTSQYLNLTKNSSLAIAIGYMDIVATIGGITLNQTGREMETMIIVLLLYLSFSLLISLFMNWYNKRIALVER